MRDESKRFDVRVIERNLRRGWISRKDYEKHLKTLHDSAANALWTHMEVEPAPHPPDVPSNVAASAPPAAEVLDDEEVEDDDEDEDEDEDEEEEAEAQG